MCVKLASHAGAGSSPAHTARKDGHVPTIVANDIELAYSIDGDGEETVVLVNGLADTKETWELQLPAFVDRYRVVTYDNRGVGEASTPPGPSPTRAIAEDARRR